MSDKCLEILDDTIVGGLDTALKDFRHKCKHCGLESTITIPIYRNISDFNDYARDIIKTKHQKIKEQEKKISELKEKVANKIKPGNLRKNKAVYGVVVDALTSRGMSRDEADNVINKIYFIEGE